MIESWKLIYKYPKIYRDVISRLATDISVLTVFINRKVAILENFKIELETVGQRSMSFRTNVGLKVVYYYA